MRRRRGSLYYRTMYVVAETAVSEIPSLSLLATVSACFTEYPHVNAKMWVLRTWSAHSVPFLSQSGHVWLEYGLLDYSSGQPTGDARMCANTNPIDVPCVAKPQEGFSDARIFMQVPKNVVKSPNR
ncbi:unnamed protein product [Ectocarpus sp. 12 AP-2014]